MYNSPMPTAVDLIRRRQKRRLRQERMRPPVARRALLGFFLAAALGAALVALLAALFYQDLSHDLPSLQALPALLDPVDGLLAEPTRIYDRTGGVELASLGVRSPFGNYLPIRSETAVKISPQLVNATIAAADPAFWDHPGFHPAGLLDPAPETIPLRLVSALLFWSEPEGLRRGLREKIYAAQLVSQYGREQVLEWHLNSADFGNMAFGAEAAARLYFGKSASRLNLAEAALLAGVSEAPDLNPFDTPELALARRNQVILSMEELGLVTREEAANALAAPLEILDSPAEALGPSSAFLQLLMAEVDPHIPAEVLARGGLSILSTLDAALQQELTCSMSVQLDRLAGAAPELPDGCASARLLPSLSGVRPAGAPLFAEAAALDPRSGQILALVALGTGDVPGSDPFPRLSAGHPPGSLLAPYVYLGAFTRGFTPSSLVWDIPAYLPPELTGSPNIDGGFDGPMRIRTALAGDALIPALQLLSQVGPANVWNTAALSGLPSAAGAPPDVLLEGGELPLVEAVHAFGAFSLQGVLIGYPDPVSPLTPTPLRPTTFIRIEDGGGRVWLEAGPPQARPVMSAPLAYTITDMLSDETARWPALGHPNALEIGRPAGVKTGFTQDRLNAWTVGFTPQISLGVWLGAGEGGALEPLAAAGLWHAGMKFATADLPPEGWAAPQGIVSLEVCEPSGLLPTPNCPVTVREVFIEGSQPVQPDTLYRRFEINRETGLLATVFTPPALIEERVFLVPPPEALSWAQQAGYGTPPERYDLVSQPPAPDPGAQVLAPEMFAYVKGVVRILGNAGGEGFESYSVQVGQGLNPQQWFQLGEPSTEIVENGPLAEWDTAGLSGLHAVRLLVVRAGNLVDTHIIQVTVDNQPPEVAALYPAPGQIFQYPQEATLTLQIVASDDLLLAGVEVYIDGSLLKDLTSPPFALQVSLGPGDHEIRVAARDQAGNISEVLQNIRLQR